MSEASRALALVAPPSPEEQARREAEAEALDARLRYIVEEVPDHPHLVTGSVAGASSSSFHTYRQSRRREQDRIAKMEEHLRAKQAADAFEAKRKELASEDEERTAKKRAKRLKKKAKKKQGGGDGEETGGGRNGGAEKEAEGGRNGGAEKEAEGRRNGGAEKGAEGERNGGAEKGAEGERNGGGEGARGEVVAAPPPRLEPELELD